MEDLKKLIREVPDFPKPGILFYDITTLLKDRLGLRSVIDGLKHHYRDAQVDVVLGIEARGFIFAPALAYALGAGFVPIRKPKKLPAECVTVTYDLEYGSDSLQMHKDAVANGTASTPTSATAGPTGRPGSPPCDCATVGASCSVARVRHVRSSGRRWRRRAPSPATSRQ